MAKGTEGSVRQKSQPRVEAGSAAETRIKSVDEMWKTFFPRRVEREKKRALNAEGATVGVELARNLVNGMRRLPA